MLLIGSRAFKYHLDGRGIKLDRIPVDWDFICSASEGASFLRYETSYHSATMVAQHTGKWVLRTRHGLVELEFQETRASSKFLRERSKLVSPLYNYQGFPEVTIAPLEVLFSIKKSHRFYPRFFAKHIKDYHLLKSLVKEDEYPVLTELRESETRRLQGRLKAPSLNKTPSEFFRDNVSNRTFIHDHIHEIMAHRERPMYEYIRVVPEKVTCSRDKFDALTFEQRIQCVLEEAYVIALERGIIPMLFEGGDFISSQEAFEWALMRICTTLTSGWFREFAWENYPMILASHNRSYPEKFLAAVQAGRIRTISETNTVICD